MEVRERIRFNGQPIDYDDFADHFEVLWENVSRATGKSAPAIPNYPQMLVLFGLTWFCARQPSVVFLEAGIGGRLDSTNVISRPLAVGFTRIGLDHQKRLGDTVSKIACEKAGIIKSRCAVVTVPQELQALQAIASKVEDIGCQQDLEIAEPCSEQDSYGNINLAMKLVEKVFQSRRTKEGRHDLNVSDMLRVPDTHIPGRFESLRLYNHAWTLDVAHNQMSLVELGRKWTAKVQATCSGLVQLPHPPLFVFDAHTKRRQTTCSGLCATFYRRFSPLLGNSSA